MKIVTKQNAVQKNITIINSLNQDIFITADEKLLISFVRNLRSPAIKLTPKNGKVNFGANELNQMFDLSVTDTGVGMDE